MPYDDFILVLKTIGLPLSRFMAMLDRGQNTSLKWKSSGEVPAYAAGYVRLLENGTLNAMSLARALAPPPTKHSTTAD